MSDQLSFISEHLVGLRMTSRRSPAGFNHSINVYWRKDVEAKALEVWGSMDNLDAELIKREEQKKELISFYLRFFDQGKRRRRRQLSRETWPVRPMRSNIRLDKPGSGQGLMSNASGRVVLAAIGINGTNFICKVSCGSLITFMNEWTEGPRKTLFCWLTTPY